MTAGSAPSSRLLVRRSALGAFAFLLGFAASVAAVRLSQADDGPSRPRSVLGTIDVNRYCSEVHGDRAIPVLVRRDATGWQCAIRDNGIFGTVAIDYDRGCTEQYGETAHGSGTDLSWPYLWRCLAGERPPPGE